VDLVPRYTIPDDRYAVVLNANAGRVTAALIAAVREVVPADRLFLTESKEHSAEVLKRCVELGFSTIFAGGGDGTIVDVINALSHLRGPSQPIPSVGVLRLGTGNALAHWLGSGAPVRDLQRWRKGVVHRTLTVPMVESEGVLFPFAGLGYDAAVLNDYNWLKGKGKGKWWGEIVKGIPGYFMAGLLKTVPNFLTRPIPRVSITNLGKPALRLRFGGEPLGEPIPTGGLLYRGRCSLLGAATTPLYGYGMRMFPYATLRPDFFQLRIMDLSALEAAFHFPACWRGTLNHPRLFDIHAERVRVVFEDAMPYQLGGEASGYRRELIFRLNPEPVHLVAQA
jgi:diacylglycerol kinase family enzyme